MRKLTDQEKAQLKVHEGVLKEQVSVLSGSWRQDPLSNELPPVVYVTGYPTRIY
jgi:hypothetical protein